MKVIKHRKGLKTYNIELYDNIDEMPIQNFAQLEKNLIIEGGVGASIGDFDLRFSSLVQFISSGHKEKAMNEVNNMRNLFWNITNDIRPDMDAYSCMIATINGEERKCTEHGIEATTQLLKDIGYTRKHVIEKDEIKKK